MSNKRRPGDRIGERYTFIRWLGDGADGEVVLANDTHLGKEVALKILAPKADQPATWDEAQLLEQLRSEFLVQVFNADVLHPSDLRYIATAYMSGGDLHRKAKPVGVPVRQAIQWGINLAHGLVRMHASGLLHRDVKPANAFLAEDGKALLGDLGKAHRMDANGRAPADGNFQTVAPEVLTDGVCSTASDIYSLGATVCYLLTGGFPVDTLGRTVDVRDRIIAGQRRRVRDLGPHVPQSVCNIIERCISMGVETRPKSALEVANQLAAARLHRRDWCLVEHPDHLVCMVGSPVKGAKAVTVCSFGAGGSGYDIKVQLSTGLSVARQQAKNVPRIQIPHEMRLRAKAL